MHIEITATGTPAAVTQSIGQQFKQARDNNPGSWPTLASLRDHVAAGITSVGAAADAAASGSETPEITVSITLDVAIAATVPEASADGAAQDEPKTARRRK